jgi:predicted ester cyclase
LRIRFAEGDKVVSRQTAAGTHKGEFQGIAPTGKKGTVTAIVIGRIVNGKFVESWTNMNSLGLMQVLGVIPPSSK